MMMDMAAMSWRDFLEMAFMRCLKEPDLSDGTIKVLKMIGDAAVQAGKVTPVDGNLPPEVIASIQANRAGIQAIRDGIDHLGNVDVAVRAKMAEHLWVGYVRSMAGHMEVIDQQISDMVSGGDADYIDDLVQEIVDRKPG